MRLTGRIGRIARHGVAAAGSAIPRLFAVLLIGAYVAALAAVPVGPAFAGRDARAADTTPDPVRVFGSWIADSAAMSRKGGGRPTAASAGGVPATFHPAAAAALVPHMFLADMSRQGGVRPCAGPPRVAAGISTPAYNAQAPPVASA